MPRQEVRLAGLQALDDELSALERVLRHRARKRNLSEARSNEDCFMEQARGEGHRRTWSVCWTDVPRPHPQLHKVERDLGKVSLTVQTVDESHATLLSQNFYNYKLEDGQSMHTYIAKVQSLVADLTTVGVNITDRQIVSKVLHGLPSSYKPVILAFEARTEAEKTLDQLTKLLLRDELFESGRNQEVKTEKNDEVPALLHHKKLNTHSNTFKKKRFDGNCHFCGKRGHIAANCHARKQKSDQQQQGSGPQPWTRSANLASTSESRTEFVSALTVTQTEDRSDYWIGDSGADEHMTPHRKWLIDYRTFENDRLVIVLGNNMKLSAAGVGSMRIYSEDGQEHLVKRVIHVPGLRKNLFSLSDIANKGHKVVLVDKKVQVLLTNNCVITGDMIQKGIYKMNFSLEKKVHLNSSVVSDEALRLWHRRLGHANFNLIKEVIKSGNVSTKADAPICTPCVKGKLTRSSFPLNEQCSKVCRTTTF